MFERNAPKALRPYLFLGVSLRWEEGDDNALGDCPFCNRPGHLSVRLSDGVANCYGCSVLPEETGGSTGFRLESFLPILWRVSLKQTGPSDYQELAGQRGLIYWRTLERWGFAKSVATGEWIVPGHDAYGKVVQIYRWVMGKSGKHCLLATPTLHHGLFGMPVYKTTLNTVYLTEGPWDGMALWEVLAARTDFPKGNVLSVPGSTTMLPEWLGLFAGKVVNLLYDNDHPRVGQNGRMIPPAGLVGMKRAAALLLGNPTPAQEVYYLRWGKNGYNLNLPHGFDIRDCLNADFNNLQRAWEKGGESEDAVGEVDFVPCGVEVEDGSWEP